MKSSKPKLSPWRTAYLLDDLGDHDDHHDFYCGEIIMIYYMMKN